MKFLKVSKKNAEKVRRELIYNRLLSNEYSVVQQGAFIFFPVTGKYKKFRLVEIDASKKQTKPRNLKEELSKILSEKEFELLVSSFDLIGNIAIVEVPGELTQKQREIGEAILRVHRNLKTVAKKLSAMEGKYRVRKFEIIAGEHTTKTTYKESGVLMKLDISKVYFSVRLAFERSRLSDLIQTHEKVLVLFAGVGPFALVIGRKHPDAQVTAVELNPDAVVFMRENILLNHLTNVTAIESDARDFCKNANEKFDRIIMPLPKTGHEFLDIAFSSVRDGGMVHFYSWADMENPYAEPMKKAREAAEKSNVSVDFKNLKIVRPYAPNVVQVVLDILVKTENKTD